MATVPEATRCFSFSTDRVSARARVDAVRELGERGVVPVEPLRGRTVHVDITKWFLPGVGVLRGTLSGLCQRAEARATDELFLGVNVSGVSSATQRGRMVPVRHGDAVLLSGSEGAFTITRPTRVRFIGVRVPRKTIAPLVARPEDAALRVISGRAGALQLLTRYVAGVLDAEMLAVPDASRLAATHLHDLIALAVGATGDAAEVAERRGVRAARLQAIKSDILANLGDDALTISLVAARHGITPRYVHKLFEDDGTTYTQFVLGQRLDRAYRLLSDPRCVGRDISAIAYDVGFGDLSYFNRTFRRRFHGTPSDIRHAGGRF